MWQIHLQISTLLHLAIINFWKLLCGVEATAPRKGLASEKPGLGAVLKQVALGFCTM